MRFLFPFLSASAQEFPKMDLAKISVSNHEFRAFSFFSLIFAIIGILPYLYLYYTTPPGYVFLGNIYDIGDHNIYFGWIYQAAEGKILWQNLFTSIPHEGAIFNAYFFAVGSLARITGLSQDMCYQIGRFTCSWLLSMSVYYFMALFFQGIFRIWGWLAAMFCTGLGWLVQLVLSCFHIAVSPHRFASLSIDTWTWEGFPFSSLLYTPLAALAIAILLCTLRWIYIALYLNRIQISLLAGFSFFLMSFVHPYDALVVMVVLVAWIGFLMLFYPNQMSRWLLHSALIFLLGACSIFYNYWILTHNPGLTFWKDQTINSSHWLGSYIFGFGVPCIVALFWLFKIFSFRTITLLFSIPMILCILFAAHLISSGLVHLLIYVVFSLFFCFIWHIQSFQHKPNNCIELLPVTLWISLFLAMVYGPIAFQRRLNIAFMVPLIVVCMKWLQDYVQEKQFTTITKKLLTATLILIASITSIQEYILAFHCKIIPDRLTHFDRKKIAFVEKENIDAFSAIHLNGKKGAVLSGLQSGNIIPRYTGLPVVLGAGCQTENFLEMRDNVAAFYSGAMTPREQQKFLTERHVVYILYGPEEREFDKLGSVHNWLKQQGWLILPETIHTKHQVFTKE